MKQGTVYFFTGLAGAGKTTIGGLFYERLKAKSPSAILLDGDMRRKEYKKTTPKDYSTEARRSGAYTQMERCLSYAEQGNDVVLCSISMYEDVRKWARDHIPNYVEIYIKVKWETLLRRDQKGLYTSGEKNVVGLDLPWDEPYLSDAVVLNDGDTTPESIVEALEKQFLSF